MARIRYIKPDFFEDTAIAELSIEARLLYIGLWTMMDKQGICECDSRLIKKFVFGYDDKLTTEKVSKLIQELVTRGFLRRIEHELKEYLFCPKFSKHQFFHHLEKPKYAIPEELISDLDNTQSIPNPVPTNASARPPGNGERVMGNGEWVMDNPTTVGDSHWLQDIWNQHKSDSLPGCRQLSKERKKSIAARIKENPNPEYWQEVVFRISGSAFCCGSSGWRASFDWFLKPDTHIKVLEGKYDNVKQGTSQTSAAQDWLAGKNGGAA